MSYTFVKITSFYKTYLLNYYDRFPEIAKASYDEQLTHMMADGFGWADFYERNLRNIGINAHEIIANAEPLQGAWAVEHGVKGEGKSIVVEQLKALKPDVVFWEDTNLFNGDFVNDVKKQVKSIRLSLSYCGQPYSEFQKQTFKGYDCILSCVQGFVDDFRRYGLRSNRLNHAFESSLLPQIETDNSYSTKDVIFFGSFIDSFGYHNTRKSVIETLLKKKIDLQVYSNLPEEKLLMILAMQGAYVFAKLLKSGGLKKTAFILPGIRSAISWDRCPQRSGYSRKLKENALHPLFGLEMLKALRRGRIGFNSHIEAAGDEAANMRLFETTGVGTCLVTDSKKNIRDFFEPDKEIVTYNSVEECTEKIQWLLDYPKELESIAKAGQQRTLKDHTYAKRAKELDTIIREYL
ncbi:MAG: glycosyltransferase family 1 protein [Syntrophus sp. (in: bacteria)]|nr:glycosyltransferase family 1 protein [Syntrophus sp. (in: bacteria)]